MADAQYEFSAKDNEMVRSLARKMKGVGAFLVLVGLLHLLTGGMFLAVIYRDNLGPEITQQIPPEIQALVEKLVAKNLHWPIAAFVLILGLVHFILGVWTRSAGSEFNRIATTQSRDIQHLMGGLTSLNKMYGLVYSLLVLGMLLGLLAVGAALYLQFAV